MYYTSIATRSFAIYPSRKIPAYLFEKNKKGLKRNVSSDEIEIIKLPKVGKPAGEGIEIFIF